jgi:uncharacterized protein (TIGR02145 family)
MNNFIHSSPEGHLSFLSPRSGFIARSAFHRRRDARPCVPTIAQSAFILLLLCWPMVLAAQNGVKVSNLSVGAGTVTFDVQWTNDHASDFVWSDTVWVFVDYNKNGVMERLPVTGATATAGAVTKISGNDKGVWVAGNARSEGSFSATVKLLSTVTNIGGACAYASNYPPVGEYTSINNIKFTGTPPFELTFNSSDEPVTLQWQTPPYTYTYTVPDEATLLSFTDATGAPGILGKKPCTTAPGATVAFEAFVPCPEEPVGTVWYLTDTREGGNDNTYKVKKMQDGRIWMVQDLKFGTCPPSTVSWNDDLSEADTQTEPTVHDGYVGHCRSTTYIDAGFLYNWPAAMQSTKTYYGGSYRGCSGTVTGTSDKAPSTCQGICPKGWHVPTGNTDGEYLTLHNAMESYTDFECSGVACWNASSQWEGVLGGHCTYDGTPNGQGSYANYWSSTYYSSGYAYVLNFDSDHVHPGINYFNNDKDYGGPVRCVRNY